MYSLYTERAIQGNSLSINPFIFIAFYAVLFFLCCFVAFIITFFEKASQFCCFSTVDVPLLLHCLDTVGRHFDLLEIGITFKFIMIFCFFPWRNLVFIQLLKIRFFLFGDCVYLKFLVLDLFSNVLYLEVMSFQLFIKVT